jgi:lipopolysaccharide/colanic/teichoic acid biosynthesis glycosyltransferase
MIAFFFWGLVALIIFHHSAYPLILKKLAKGHGQHTPVLTGELPTIALIIPAFQEQKYIAMKMEDALALNYPSDKLKVIIACDGCTDQTVSIIEKLLLDPRFMGRNFILRDFQINRGKVAVLNQVIAECDDDVIALSDVSAMLSTDALLKAAAHFQQSHIGVVCGTYVLGAKTSQGEQVYWDYQKQIKQNEAAISAPMGAHGAFYAFRRALWSPLPLDTINDDFILPMQIVANGHRAVYDTSIIATEIEPTGMTQDYRRRIRISAGNIQQALRLWRLANPRNPGLAFLFLAGKGARAFMPAMMFLAFWLNAALAFTSSFYTLLLISQALLYLLATTNLVKPLTYLIRGHFAGLIGTITYFIGFERAQWIENRVPVIDEGEFISQPIRIMKRMSDIAGASIIFIIFLIVLIPLAVLIKLDSKGPVFFRQLRVGLSTRTQTKLFYLVKFRTMSVDAESKSGAVWAAKQDPRVTRIGGFLRKTRLDELPQAINVLRGEMAIVGPRPERPAFFNKLEDDIPFFSERVCHLKPGITGLAQVELGYPVTIEETRAKVMLDHAYAMRISRLWSWFKTDTSILFQTVGVVIYKKGH